MTGELYFAFILSPYTTRNGPDDIISGVRPTEFVMFA